MDSDEAVAIANEQHLAKHGNAPAAMTYVLFNGQVADMGGPTLHPELRWVIGGDPDGQRFQLDIDARTGELLSEP